MVLIRPASVMVCIGLFFSLNRVQLLPTFPVEYAVERADLVVLGERAGRQGDLELVRVQRVLFGDAGWKGKEILVRLSEFATATRWGEGGKGEGIELKDAPLLLCLSRKVINYNKAPPNAFELDSTELGTAIKVIDGSNVYGYYQYENPGPYVLTRERNGRDELLRKVNRAVELTRVWANVVAVADVEARQKAILTFLADRTLPSHFSWQACETLSSTKLTQVILDEIEHVKEDPNGMRAGWECARDERQWTRLGSALMWVKDDGESLLPLLQRVQRARPGHKEAAVQCASRACGPKAVPFLKQAMLDGVCMSIAAYGLCRIGTTEAQAALEDALTWLLTEQNRSAWGETQSYATKWPQGWKVFAARLEKDFPNRASVQRYLAESWKSLVAAKVFTPEDVPARFKE